ncbi:MAG: hypothetical protein HDR92_07400 [Bacteroides sp.]|nr:hypothetical protein [Bacteroides sp.]
MKRISLICAALAATLTMSAQKALVDEVKNDIKSNPSSAQKALTKIQPALSDPESAEQAYTWFTAGQAALTAYDQLRAMEGLSPQGLTPEQKATAGQNMIAVFGYFDKALPLDQVPDAKGKVKPKYTKDINKAIKENYIETQRAGIYLYEAGKYPEAVEAWDLYLNIPSKYPDAKVTADDDTIRAQMMYYQALAMSFSDNAKGAVNRMRDAMNTGYKTPELYLNSLAIANQAQDSVAVSEFAQRGYEIYGTQNIAFIGQLINDKLAQNDYDGCINLVNEALASDPDVQTKAQLYDILGCIDANQDKNDAALDNFDKAIELNPEFAKGYYDKGRIIYNTAIVQWDDATEDVRQNTLKPEIIKAAQLFEKAYELDEVGMSDVTGTLYRLYYLIEGEESPNTQKWHNM